MKTPLFLLPILASLLLNSCAPKNAPAPATAEVKPTEESDPVFPGIVLSEAGLAAAKLEFAPAAKAESLPVAVWGRLSSDPAANWELRAPAAGILQALDGKAWPQHGSRCAAGDLLQVIPDPSPREQLDLETARLDLGSRRAGAGSEALSAAAEVDAAKAEIRSSEAALELARANQKRQQELAKIPGEVAAKTLGESAEQLGQVEARLSSARAKLAQAQAQVLGKELVAKALKDFSAADKAGQAILLKAPAAGEIRDAPLGPGSRVEAGQLVLRAADPGRLILEAEVMDPACDLSALKPGQELTLQGDGLETLKGSFAGLSSRELPHPAVLVSLRSDKLRPGALLRVLLPGPAAEGLSRVPASAVVFWNQQAWVYVKGEDRKFERHPLENCRPAGDSMLTSSAFDKDAEIVTKGAQSLLSEELRAMIPKEED